MFAGLAPGPQEVLYRSSPGACVNPTIPFSDTEKMRLNAALDVARRRHGWTYDPSSNKGLYTITPFTRVLISKCTTPVILIGILYS